MDAAVSLHHHGALPSAVASSLPPQHHALHLRHPVLSIPTRLTATAAPSRTPQRSSSSSAVAGAPVPGLPARTTASSSSTRAATGYAAALADASLRAGTLPRAARHARALLRRLQQDRPRGQRLEEEADDRVSALVGMLIAKGKSGLVAEVLAEFAAICHHMLPPSSASSKRARSAS
uniref:Uncharacterized protein n=1 Tax=Avena sativa TaxID=4498 RepID=A0ACD6A877_AVESA